MIEKLRGVALVGTAAEVADKLHALARKLELDEIVINTWTFDPQRDASLTRFWPRRSASAQPCRMTVMRS